ncbi:hypothetical protein J6590_004302 [Homalodisca vitripennis]|nr:hypothetical protein J6590_004302 [Homalodisca vitripennis]
MPSDVEMEGLNNILRSLESVTERRRLKGEGKHVQSPVCCTGRTEPEAIGGGDPEGGTPVSQLQLEPEALQNVLEGCSSSGEGTSNIRLNPGSVLGAVEAAVEAGYVCKACRLAFSSEAGVVGHQKNCGGKGTLRLIRSKYNCTRCECESFETIHDFQRHFESSHPSDPALAPSPGLSHEMEDVVNQITALAAKAAAQSPPDSNANIFCPPPEPKKPKMFHSVPVPSTGH